MTTQTEALDMLKTCWPKQSAEWYTENVPIIASWILIHDMRMLDLDKELRK